MGVQHTHSLLSIIGKIYGRKVIVKVGEITEQGGFREEECVMIRFSL